MIITPPSNCPSCDSALVWINDQLYCKNPNCLSKCYKQLEHFAKTLKIKGLGPSTIEKLDITSILDIYDLDPEYIMARLKSEKLGIKLFDEIRKSSKESLNTVLPAFGISLIGKTASDKLSKVVSSIYEIDESTCKEAGLGPKATENLLNWLEDNLEIYCEALPFSFEFEKSHTVSEVKGIVCISGKLKSFKTKAEAKAVLENLGYTVKDSLTKDVTILVNESEKLTAKTEKARDSGVTIVTNLKDFIGEKE